MTNTKVDRIAIIDIELPSRGYKSVEDEVWLLNFDDILIINCNVGL